ncbi:PEP/pyruvate-binding domain-containing protein [Fodinibius sp. SL11]|uniref:PEP/pyruvate-binding domain-containing protein n=1 Tax=Fodinibius sp. SL11 TaxID=3425690 RepID=UPI003F8812F8
MSRKWEEKNASLGEMIQHLEPLGINIPSGFATTSAAYRAFIRENELEAPIRDYLRSYHDKKITVEEASREIRTLIQQGAIPSTIIQPLKKYYKELSEKYDTENVDVAVRSSATAEDLPSASFAGLQETYLNIRGEKELLEACKNCFSSLFTARGIVYREEKGFDHFKIALSVGIQKMIRADRASSGVIFTIDTETGFPNVIVINGTWGLGENVVRGIVNPDQFTVFKPLLDHDKIVPIVEKKLGNKEQKMIYSSDDGSSVKNVKTTPEEQSQYVLTDTEIITLARWAKTIEEHYQRPMDIEWVKDDRSNELYIVQARPETVHSVFDEGKEFKNYTLLDKKAPVLITGLSIGSMNFISPIVCGCPSEKA